MVEQQTHNLPAAGSSPAPASIYSHPEKKRGAA